MKKYFLLFSFVILLLFLFVFGRNMLRSYQGKSIVEPTSSTNTRMKITSSAFLDNQSLPSKYTCDGENINPPLSFSDIPENAKSLVLIMDDPDAPSGTFVHWILYNVSPQTTTLEEGKTPLSDAGKNGTGKATYFGACPPSGTHRYFFKLYALDRELQFSETPDKKAIEDAMQGHILEEIKLIGLYQRVK